ncbi:hypothetical protein GPJ56_003320 [Histomonas meleagridis]|uniref:uncharacterized protein n=1 Tax=Histomonas meleagridis TaxID=135588 RepID=UPI003559EA5C|nr:hypothetical protein GPJ56_003320 [Histomonas meleagridis]KAH0804939.1 hypothetical protein GO595_001884 [Histomonas meleagridis]
MKENYSSSFETFKNAKNANSFLYKSSINRLKELDGYFETISNSFSSIDHILPVHSNNQNESNETEPKPTKRTLSQAWNEISDIFFNDMSILNRYHNILKTLLIPRLENLIDNYAQKNEAIDSKFQEAAHNLDKVTTEFNTAQTEYKKFCELIESLHSALVVDPNKQKIRDQLNDKKFEFKKIQETAYKSVDNYNITLDTFFSTSEQCLTHYEQCDKEREDSISKLYITFAEEMSNLSQSIKDNLSTFLSEIDTINSQDEIDEELGDDIEADVTFDKAVNFGVPKFNFNISEYIDGNEIFADAMKQYECILNVEHPHMTVGETYNVIQSDEVESTVVASNGVTFQVPNEKISKKYPNYNRRVCRVNQQVDKNELQALVGEPVLIMYSTEGIGHCMNIYGEEGNISMEKLL